MPDIELSASFDFHPSFEDVQPTRHLVLVLHGILDNSTWANTLHRGRFADIDIAVRPISYKMIGPLALVLGLGLESRKNYIVERINNAIEINAYDKISIICHSNGTKLFAEIASEVCSKFDYIFLCASICHHNDDFKFRSTINRVINECGTRDIWPTIISWLRPRTFGNTGVVGFGNEPFIDRFYDYGHGEATKSPHFQEYIVPVLATGMVAMTEHTPSKRTLLAPYFWSGAAAAILAIACFLWIIF